MTSCQTMVELDVPDLPPKLVVNSLFSPDSVWQINISSTIPIFSIAHDRLLYKPVPVLRDENGTVVPLEMGDPENPHSGPANSEDWDFQATTMPVPGKSYTLQVSAI